MSTLYERVLPQGPVVRIRRVAPTGGGAVCAVIEVDRRVGRPRQDVDPADVPPPLMAVEGDSEPAVMASLLPFAEDDAAVARLLAERGMR